MGGVKGAHHRGRHQRLAKHCTDTANANPDTRCWKCHRTLAEIRRAKSNARWVAGHVVRAQVGGPYLPECSECSGREGAALTNTRNQRTDLTW